MEYKFSKNEIKKLSKLIEENANVTNFKEWLRLNQEEFLKELAEEKLKEEKYPKEATYNNVKWAVSCIDKKESEFWTDVAIEKELVTEEDVENQYRDFFLNDRCYEMKFDNRNGNIEIKITFLESVNEWEENFVSKNYIERCLEKNWDANRISEEVIENEHPILQETIQERLNEEGFSPNANYTNVPFEVETINNYSFGEWAEITFEKFDTAKRKSITEGKDYSLYLSEENGLSFRITFKVTAEEWEQENELNEG